MSKDLFSVCVLVFFLLGIAVFVNRIEKVEAVNSPPLTINADGTVTPSTTLITTSDNITYTLTDNITTDSGNQVINVQRNNIILDGAGYTIQHVNRVNGIYLGYRNNVTVKNIRIIDCDVGIRLDANTWITIDNCTITGNYRGILNGYTAGPKNFTFTNNEVRARDEGVDISSTYDSTIAGNIIQAEYGLVLRAGENVTIRGNLITGCSMAGIWPLALGPTSTSCYNINIFENTFRNNYCGVWKAGGNDTTLKIYHNYFIDNTEAAIADHDGYKVTVFGMTVILLEETTGAATSAQTCTVANIRTSPEETE